MNACVVVQKKPAPRTTTRALVVVEKTTEIKDDDNSRSPKQLQFYLKSLEKAPLVVAIDDN